MFGPVFRFEAIRTARQGRFYAARVLLGVALLVYAMYEAERWGAFSHHSGGRTARFAATSFVRFGVAQFLALVAIVPALLGGAFGIEARKRTLDDLLGSPLSCAAILADKVAGRLLHVGVGLLMGLPIMGALGMLGGVDPVTFGKIYGVTAATLAFLVGLSALVSVLVLKPGLSIVLSYLLTIVWMALPFLVMPWLGGATGRSRAAEAVLFHHPVGLGVVEWNDVAAQLDRPGFRIWAVVPWSQAGLYVRLIGGHAGLGLLLFGLAILVLKVRRAGGLAGRRRSFRSPTFVRPPVGDRPMLWKERYATSGWLGSRWVVVLLGVLAALIVLIPLRDSIRATVYFGQPMESLRDDLRSTFAWAFVGVLALVAISSSLTVVGEKERETWTSLRTTLLTGREIVRAKQLGSLWRLRGLIGGFAALWVVGLIGGVLSWVGVLASAIGLGVFLWYAAALGVFVSTKAQDSGRSAALAIAILALATIGYVFPILAIWNLWIADRWRASADDVTYLLVGVSPYLEWASLLAPGELGRLGEGLATSPWSRPILGYRGPRIVPTILLGWTIHGLMAWGLTTLSIRALDRPIRQAARPESPGESAQPAAVAVAG